MSREVNVPKRIVEAEQGHTGIMVAFMLDAATAEQLALPGGEPAQDLHVTLAFLGDSTDFVGGIDALKQTLAQFAAQASPVQGATSGLGRFTPSDSSDSLSPVIALVNIAGLQEWRNRLVSTLEEAGYAVANDFDYTPHITLAYIDADAPLPLNSVEQVPLQFDTLWLAFGDERTAFPLNGATMDMNEAQWDQGARKAYHDAHPENFAAAKGDDPLAYPIKDGSDVRACATLYGKSANPEQCKANIIRIAKRLTLTKSLPDAWQEEKDDGKTTESTTLEAVYQPRPRIAQLKVRWLSDNAISRNGRQYPPESVNRLVQSGQISLQSETIINSYICHGVAEEDNPLVVSGKATRIWKEGADAYALFDIPDTTTGRDMVSLLQGGYIPPTMSLRATGAEMKVERGRGTPQVVGDGLTLQGIDFTMRPGIPDARIQELLLEAAPATEETFLDSFALSDISLISEQEDSHTMATKAKASEPQPEQQAAITEEANQKLTPLASGTSQGTDGTPGSEYTKKFPQTNAQIPANDFLKQVTEEAQATHDHMASALGMACAPSAKTTEAGRKFARVAEAHMVATHDAAAKRLGLACEGAYQAIVISPADDDDDDDTNPSMESVAPPTKAKKEPKKMTEDELKAQALALLEAQGYAVHPPKTEAQKIQEAIEAKLAEQARQFEEAQKQQREEFAKMLAERQPAAQRKTLVEGVTNERQPLANSPRARRSRVQENLLNADWQELADRSAPLPEGVTPEMVMEHFGRLLMLEYGDKWGNQNIRPAHS